ncbi:MAG: PRC-barrel domain-containing protein [Bacillota bacterium]
MFRVSDIIDMPIVSLKSGKRLCTVKSAMIDIDTNRLLSLICKEAIVKKHIEIIPYKKVIGLSLNEVTVYDEKVFIRLKSNMFRNGHMKFEYVIGRQLYNKDKEIIGTITDMYFEPLSGRIMALEISEGYIDDLISGRKTISTTDSNLGTYRQ